MFRLKICLTKTQLVSGCIQQQKVQLSTTTVSSRRRRKNDDDVFPTATHPSDGYVRDFLEQTVKRDMKNLDSSIDYEASLLETARRRKLASEHAKEMKEINPKKDMTRKFTFKQMDQIKWLNFEDPQKWNYNNLARSFCSDPNTMRRIVQGSHQPNEEVRRLLDAQVLGKKRSISLYESEKMDHSNSTSGKELDIFKPPTKEESIQHKHVKTDDTFDTNKWFKNIKNAPSSKVKKQTYPTLQLFNSLEDLCEEDQLDPDDLFAEDEHFEELFTHEDEEERMDDEDFDESEIDDQVDDDDENQVKVEPLQIVTKDHVNFYDEQGRFLYKIG